MVAWPEVRLHPHAPTPLSLPQSTEESPLATPSLAASSRISSSQTSCARSVVTSWDSGYGRARNGEVVHRQTRRTQLTALLTAACPVAEMWAPAATTTQGEASLPSHSLPPPAAHRGNSDGVTIYPANRDPQPARLRAAGPRASGGPQSASHEQPVSALFYPCGGEGPRVRAAGRSAAGRGVCC